MKRQREEEVSVSVSLSLSLGAAAEQRKRQRRRGGAEAAAGGEFVCKTCSRGFASFQALGGHRTSHLRGRHGLALGLTVAGADQSSVVQGAATKKTENNKAATSHRCHVCGLGFEMGQALGGHMRRHREEAAAAASAVMVQQTPVLLELFV